MIYIIYPTSPVDPWNPSGTQPMEFRDWFPTFSIPFPRVSRPVKLRRHSLDTFRVVLTAT